MVKGALTPDPVLSSVLTGTASAALVAEPEGGFAELVAAAGTADDFEPVDATPEPEKSPITGQSTAKFCV